MASPGSCGAGLGGPLSSSVVDGDDAPGERILGTANGDVDLDLAP
jgi:hypothetical protein